MSPETSLNVSESDSKNLNVDGPLQWIKLDEFGPMVVNNDGVGNSFAFFSHQITEAPSAHSLLMYVSIHVILLVDAFSNRKLGANDGHGTRKDGSCPFQEE